MDNDPQHTGFSQLLSDIRVYHRRNNDILHEGFGRAWRENNRFHIQCSLNCVNDSEPLGLKDYQSGELIDRDDHTDLVGSLPNGKLFIFPNVHFFLNLLCGSTFTFTDDSRYVWIGTDYPAHKMTQEIHVTYDILPNCFRTLRESPKNQLGLLTAEFTGRRWCFGGYILKLDILDSKMIVRIRTQEAQPVEQLLQNVMLAMSFATGSIARFTMCSVVHKSNSYQILSAEDNHIEPSKLLGPFASLKIKPKEALDLLSLAFKASLLQHDHCHELFSHALSITKTQTAFPEDHISACSRALEYACRVLDIPDSQVDKAQLKQECSDIRQALVDMNLPLMGQRLEGYLQSINTFSASKALKSAENAGLIPPKSTKAYQEMRHKVAHGTILETSESDNVYWNSQLLKDSFYKLVLRHIGYRGRMVRYSIPGWPLEAIE